jgi:hypothetical protein
MNSMAERPKDAVIQGEEEMPWKIRLKKKQINTRSPFRD